MKRLHIIIVCLLLTLVAEAQTSKLRIPVKQTTRTVTKKTTKKTIKKPVKEEVKKDTVAAGSEPKMEKPKYKSLTDSMLVRYVQGGFVGEGKLYLTVNPAYRMLNRKQKEQVVDKLHADFPRHDIVVHRGTMMGDDELWMAGEETYTYLDAWNVDSLRLDDYLPRELKRRGRTKMFYYVGGSMNGSKDGHNGRLSVSGGTYLYRDMIDVSLGLDFGFDKTGDEKAKFAGDLSLSSRYYLPLRIRRPRISPYVGAGVSWSFAPESYCELQVLAGGCWYIGPGSLDLGLEYGKESKFSLTLGYTFRIPAKVKGKKRK